MKDVILLSETVNKIQNIHYIKVFQFVLSKKEQMQSKKIVVSTINNYLKPIKKLCKLNDIHIKWEKITSGLPKQRKYAEDRAPLLEEIQKLVEYPDRRLKAIVIIMASSGIRLAAWDDLKLKHIQPKKDKYGKIIAAKITVYAEQKMNTILLLLQRLLTF